MNSLFIMYLAGLAVGVVSILIIKGVREYSGTLQIDHTNQEKDVYRIVLNDFDSLDKKKRIILKVDHGADLSQK